MPLRGLLGVPGTLLHPFAYIFSFKIYTVTFKVVYCTGKNYNICRGNNNAPGTTSNPLKRDLNLFSCKNYGNLGVIHLTYSG